MRRLTEWVLAHRRLVVAGWVALALIGGATAATTTSRLGKTFDLPGHPSFETAARVATLYGGEAGGQDPTVPVISAPAGRVIAGTAGRGLMRRVEHAASLGGRYRVVGFGSTGSTRFSRRGWAQRVLAGVYAPGGVWQSRPDTGDHGGGARRAAGRLSGGEHWD